jgi:hypothetical protein
LRHLRRHLWLCRPYEELAEDVIPDRLVLPLVLFVSLVVMRDTIAPVVDGARVVEVPFMVVMVMRSRGVLENLVCQDVQLSRLQIFLSTKVGEVMLGLA